MSMQQSDEYKPMCSCSVRLIQYKLQRENTAVVSNYYVRQPFCLRPVSASDATGLIKKSSRYVPISVTTHLISHVT